MQVGQDETILLQFAFVAEVDQVANLLPSDPHVVEKLSFVVGNQFADRFQFDNDAFINK